MRRSTNFGARADFSHQEPRRSRPQPHCRQPASRSQAGASRGSQSGSQRRRQRRSRSPASGQIHALAGFRGLLPRDSYRLNRRGPAPHRLRDQLHDTAPGHQPCQASADVARPLARTLLTGGPSSRPDSLLLSPGTHRGTSVLRTRTTTSSQHNLRQRAGSAVLASGASGKVSAGCGFESHGAHNSLRNGASAQKSSRLRRDALRTPAGRGARRSQPLGGKPPAWSVRDLLGILASQRPPSVPATGRHDLVAKSLSGPMQGLGAGGSSVTMAGCSLGRCFGWSDFSPHALPRWASAFCCCGTAGWA